MKQENFVRRRDGSPKAVNLCMDCKHRIPRLGPNMFSNCRISHTTPTGFDIDIQSCSLSRLIGPCGEDGVLWEQKEYKKPWWRFWG